MRALRRARLLGEYLLFGGLMALLESLPTRAGLAVGRAAGMAFYVLSPHRRRRTIANLTQALHLDRPAARRLARRCYRHLGETFAESVLLSRRRSRTALKDCIEVHGEEHVLRAREEGRGAVFAAGHLGNWELVGWVAASLYGEVVSLAAVRNDRPLDRMVIRRRSRMGLSIIPRKGGLRTLLRALRRNCGVGILMDHDARRHGINVPFFGLPASTSPSAARLALLSGAPIIPCTDRRIGPMRHRVTFYPPVRPEGRDRHEAVHACTAQLTAIIERAIREAPEQWTWPNSRWKTGLQRAEGRYQDDA